MVNYYSSNGDIENFSNSYPSDYIAQTNELPSSSDSNDNSFEVNPVTIPFHDNFTLVGHMDFDGKLNTIDVLEKVSITKPNPDNYPDFKDIIGECQQEIDIVFSEATINDNKMALHFKFLLHKLDNGQPFYFCYYLDKDENKTPMIWITFALRNTNSSLNKHIYLYTFQLNNLYSQFSDFKSAYNTELKTKNYSYFNNLLKQNQIVYKWYVMKFGSSYSDDYINTMSRSDYLNNLNFSFVNGLIKDFKIIGHNDFDNNIVTKDNILITPEEDGIKIGVTPTLKNYGQSITMKLNRVNQIWRYGKIVPIKNYGFYPVTITHKINNEVKDNIYGNDFFYARIIKRKDEENNYMIIIYKLKESVYKPIIDKLSTDAGSDYYIHYPAEDIGSNRVTYEQILINYPFQWDSESEIFNWIMISSTEYGSIVESTKPSSFKKPTKGQAESSNTDSKTEESNMTIYILIFLITIVALYILYVKFLSKPIINSE